MKNPDGCFCFHDEGQRFSLILLKLLHGFFFFFLLVYVFALYLFVQESLMLYKYDDVYLWDEGKQKVFVTPIKPAPTSAAAIDFTSAARGCIYAAARR